MGFIYPENITFLKRKTTNARNPFAATVALRDILQTFRDAVIWK
jgi:hypothetical protein